MMLNIGANVNDAVQGLGFVADRTKQLQTQIEYLRGKLADTKSEKFYANALGIIAQKQTELNRIQKATGEALNKTSVNSAKATQSLTDLSRIAQDAPYGFNAIANNLNPLIESFGRLKTSTGSTGGALKALAAGLAGPAGIGIAVAVASSLMVKFGGDLFGASEASKKLADEQKKLAEEQKAVISGMARENSEVSILVGQLKKENLSREQKTALLNKLKQINPTYFGDLKNEAGLVDTLNIAYGKYLASLVRRTEAELLTKDLEKLSTTILELERKGAVRTSLLPKGVGFDENRKITNENLKQLGLSRELEDSLKERDALLKRILEKSDIPVDFSNVKVKQDKPLDLVFQPIVPDLTNTLKNPIIQALKSPDILSESQQIAKIINDSIEKNVKPLSKSIKLQEVAPEDLAFAKQYVDALGTINEAINSIQIQGLASLGEAIGAAFSGGSIGNVFKSFVETIAMGITAIGKQLITLGVAAQKVQIALKALFTNPIAMIAAGVGLIAVGSAIRGALSNGIEGRANGGPVSGQTPYIIGERGPELFVPSVAGSIIPNNRMTSFSGRTSMASSGGGRSIVRGNDILLAYARTSRSQNRVNA